MVAACVLAFSLSACKGDDGLPPGITLKFITDTASPHYGSVEAWPVSDRVPVRNFRPFLNVTVGDTFGLALLGRYEVEGHTLRFHPRSPPKAGVTYYARWEGGVQSWRVPADSSAPKTVVTAVYPRAKILPANLRRVYVEFSGPMSSGRALEYIKLYAGDSSIEAFSSEGGRLEDWDPDKQRLTLTVLFDPVRARRDRGTNEQLGPLLREGMSYRLVIDSAWPDAAGRPLRERHAKAFLVQGAERRLVRTADWTISPPRAGTRDTLVVRFPRPLDFMLLQQMVAVRTEGNATIAGQRTVVSETRWVFVPRSQWEKKEYYVSVDTRLEDLAGNNITRLFENKPGDPTGPAGRTVIPFVPR